MTAHGLNFKTAGRGGRQTGMAMYCGHQPSSNFKRPGARCRYYAALLSSDFVYSGGGAGVGCE